MSLDILKQSYILIGRFLAAQGHVETLAAFRRETGLELPDYVDPKAPDLREVIENYLASQMQSLAIVPAPLEEELAKLVITRKLPEKVSQTVNETTNVLSVVSAVFPKRSWNSSQGRFIAEFIPCIMSAAVDRTIKIYSISTFDLLDSYAFPSPVLSISIDPSSPRFLIASMMEGSVHLIDLVKREVIQKLKDHNKYVVRSAFSDDGKWLATAGYDKVINLYEVTRTESTEEAHALLDGEEEDELSSTSTVTLVKRHSENTRTNPEGLVFLRDSTALVYSAREDHILHYIDLPTFALSGYNLNPNGDSWVSFSVLSISIHPTLPILCLQTSTTSSRILLYPFRSAQRLSTLFTTAEQSDFGTPRHSWLPDGTAVVVTSEDGVLRIIDLQGKVRMRIGAHGAASPIGDDEGSVEGRSERVRARREMERGSSVVKDVACIEDPVTGELSFVSGGFDKTIRVISV